MLLGSPLSAAQAQANRQPDSSADRDLSPTLETSSAPDNTTHLSDSPELSQSQTSYESETIAQAETLEVSTTAEALRIPLRFSINFDSERGGTSDFLSFDSFFPFGQTPGQSLFYVSPRIRFDFAADNTFGGNVLVGYRTYDADRDRILGGYVAIDARDTGDVVFPQIGFGFERLGRFDIRANGYVPVGDTNQVTDSSSFTVATLGGEPFFEGNQLLIPLAGSTTTTIEQRQVALGGFDVETGATLVRFNDDGRVGLYGGVYYLAGDNVSIVGGRGRLEFDPVKRIRLGLGVQGDSLFGTRVFFNAGVQIPNPSELSSPDEEQQRIIDEAGHVVGRLGEPVARTNTIVVDEQQEVDVTSTGATGTVAAINPETGEPFFFTFVESAGTPTSNSSATATSASSTTAASSTAAASTEAGDTAADPGDPPGGSISIDVTSIEFITLSVAEGTGTFEDPINSVPAALAATLGDGNDVVLVSVAPDAVGPIPAFTIPDNVTVLSDGIPQFIDTAQVGSLQLPGTGTGIIPVIDGLVTQGVNTDLSGFIELDIQVIGDVVVSNFPTTNLDFGELDISLTNIGNVFESPGVTPISSNFAVTTAELEAFLGLAPGDLDALGNGDGVVPSSPAVEGSAVSIDINITVPDSSGIAFNANFLTDEGNPAPPEFNDFAFLTVDGVAETLANTTDVVPSDGDFITETGPQPFSVSPSNPNAFRLGFGVVDLGETNVESRLDITDLNLF